MANVPDFLRREVDPDAFLEPVEFILDEHYRQRQFCDALDALTSELDVRPVAELASDLIAFLTEDLRLHLEDEERDFFPLLRRRCRPEDGIGEVLDLLSEEHGLDEDLVDFLLEDLRTLASGHQLANATRLLVNVREFAETQRRHLAWENALLLPVAKRRLDARDKVTLGQRMASRRGLAPAVRS